MNLHGIAGGAIAAVNPFETVGVSISTGYTTDASGKRTPQYRSEAFLAQVQALSFRDLQQLDGLNLNGVRRKMYFFGEVDAVVRMNSKGGDVITRSDNTVWLVAMVLETWPDWCSIVATLQDSA